MSLVLSPGILTTGTGTDMILLDERRGRYWCLNTTATLTLRALLGGATPERAVLILIQRYPEISAQRAEHDVTALLESLCTARLVTQT
ncbi:lasso peptide biosynthesis PqqD family chaperone [Streptomyces luteireticuli]|uniref:lasso peptide biosynthesis PqqD family chaperone n=1 Tax=Streptomyces luteireticuli TaxID=173858 RepID=UPI0035567E22